MALCTSFVVGVAALAQRPASTSLLASNSLEGIAKKGHLWKQPQSEHDHEFSQLQQPAAVAHGPGPYRMQRINSTTVETEGNVFTRLPRRAMLQGTGTCTDIPTDNVAFESFQWRKNFTCNSCQTTYSSSDGSHNDTCGYNSAWGMKAPNPEGCKLEWAEPKARKLTEGMEDALLNYQQYTPPTLSVLPGEEHQDSLDLQADLEKMAWPSSVNLSQTTFVLHPWEAGVGLTIQMMVLPVLDALVRGHTLWAPHLDIWADPERCPQSDLSCHFASLQTPANAVAQTTADGELQLIAGSADGEEKKASKLWSELIDTIKYRAPIANRSIDVYWRYYFNDTARDELETSIISEVETLCSQHGVKPPHMKKYWWAMQQDETDILSQLPSKYLRHGRAWLVAQVTRFLVQPNAFLANELKVQREALGLAEGGANYMKPYLSVHLRRGDGCTDRGGVACKGLNDTMPQIDEALAKYGMSTVFVATTDSSVFEAKAARTNVSWMHRQTHELSMNTSKDLGVGVKYGLEKSLFMRMTNAHDEWSKFMVDAYLMADATLMIGAFESTVLRLVYAMAYGIYGCAKPYISLSWSWCWRTWLSGAHQHLPFLHQETSAANKWSLPWSRNYTTEPLTLGACLGNGDIIRSRESATSEVKLADGLLYGSAGC